MESDQEVVPFDPSHLPMNEPLESANPVVMMHYEISRAQVPVCVTDILGLLLTTAPMSASAA